MRIRSVIKINLTKPMAKNVLAFAVATLAITTGFMPVSALARARIHQRASSTTATEKSTCFQAAKNLRAEVGQKLNMFLDCQTAKTKFSGIILVAYDNDDLKQCNILTERSFGFADVSPGHARMNDNNTEVLLGSVTKQFVSAQTLKLIAEDKLDIDAKAVDLIPEVDVFRDKRWKNITIRELLAHGSGIPDYVNVHSSFNKAIAAKEGPEQIIKDEARNPLKFSPGKKAAYSNTNYLILGRILEHVSHMTWAEIVEKEIREPLLLRHTGIYSLSNIHSEYAVGYEQPAHTEAGEGEHRDPKLFTAVGDMYSTVEDLFLWEHYLFSTNIIVPSQVRAQYLEQPLISEFSAGAITSVNGFGDEDTKGRHVVFKTGHLSGYANVVSYFPKEKLVIVILSNTEEYKWKPFIKPMLAKLAGVVFSFEKSTSSKSSLTLP